MERPVVGGGVAEVDQVRDGRWSGLELWGWRWSELGHIFQVHSAEFVGSLGGEILGK